MSPEEAYYKCSNENRRIPELESIIATDSDYSYFYASNIIKGRWEKGERSIATDYYLSYYYAFNIINGRWEQGEKNIATDPAWSYCYARDVLKNAFYLCHSNIFNSSYKKPYINFLKSINYDLHKIVEWLI